MVPKPRTIGLREIKLDEEDLEEIAATAEDAVARSLEKYGRRFLQSSIIVDLDYKGGELVVNIEVEASGLGLGRASYYTTLDEAVAEGFKALEEKLHEIITRRKQQERRQNEAEILR